MRKWSLFSIKDLLVKEELILVSAIWGEGDEINWNAIKEPRRFKSHNRRVSKLSKWDIAKNPQFFEIKRLD